VLFYPGVEIPNIHKPGRVVAVLHDWNMTILDNPSQLPRTQAQVLGGGFQSQQSAPAHLARIVSIAIHR